jgi:hypothetical protein
VGFIGLPPVGAVPSDPTRTELLEIFWRPRHGGPFYQGAAFLYADGRLIWNEYVRNASAWRSTGWLEQRLTPSGIELVRALAGRPETDEFRVLDPAGLPAQLPNHAWIDSTVRPYVPSGFAACLHLANADATSPYAEPDMTLEERLGALPRAVADLLRDRPLAVKTSGAYGDTGCLELDVADARLLDTALREAGFDGGPDRFMLRYGIVLDEMEGGTWTLGVWFEPVLPDGTITCSGCG